MRKPKNRGTAISPERIAEWLSKFRHYRTTPDEDAVNLWLSRFSEADKDIAARVLDCVEMISEGEIHEGYRDALGNLDGWHSEESNRAGRWFFVGFGKPSESGHHMLRLFREANRLTAAKHDDLFISARDLAGLGLGSADTVVFIDDFAGTGDQVCDRWPMIKELMIGSPRVYLIFTTVTRQAYNRICEVTAATIVSYFTTEIEDNIFSSYCKYFNKTEQSTLVTYCEKADLKKPKGHGECGLLWVLAHKTPNNSIPILHANHPKWVGIFPRFL